MSDDDHTIQPLGTIGETEVYLVAVGPKARWCTDVLSQKFERTFLAVRSQVSKI